MRRLTIQEARESLKIDRDDLDTELTLQPGLFADVSKEWAMSMSRRDKLKDEVATTRARLYIDFRKKKADEKPTETLLASYIEIEPEYAEVRNRYLDACAETDEWSSIKEAFMQRSYAIKDLVVLFQASYFSPSSVAGPKSSEAEYERGRQRIAEARRAQSTTAPSRARLNDD